MHHHHPTENEKIAGALIVAQGLRNEIRASRPSSDDEGGFPWLGLIISFIVGCVLLGPLMIIIAPVIGVLLLLVAIFG